VLAISDFDKSPFVGPRRAFEIVGNASLRNEWSDDVFDKSSPHHMLILTRLLNILKSGEVDAHWNTFDLSVSGTLLPIEIDHEYFSLRLQDDTVFHAGVNEPVQCRIHAKQLDRCLLGIDKEQPSFTSAEEKKCLFWFVELLSNTTKKRLSVNETEQLAKSKFSNVSGAGIKRARLTAVEKTGKHEIFRAGRPKIQSMS
jgi:hypothetical protein